MAKLGYPLGKMKVIYNGVALWQRLNPPDRYVLVSAFGKREFLALLIAPSGRRRPLTCSSRPYKERAA